MASLLSTTTQKLEYYQTRLEDLIKCLDEPITRDCRKFVNEEITKAKKNIEYFEGILEVLKKE